MPEELFRLYMEPMVLEHGWPFYSVNSHTPRLWLQQFDCHDFKFISELRWQRTEIPFSLGRFHRLSQQQIFGLRDVHMLGVQSIYATIPGTKDRFRNAREYIAGKGRMPIPVVLMQDVKTLHIGQLRILDGNHRLAAMASFSNATDGIVDCWIGSPP